MLKHENAAVVVCANDLTEEITLTQIDKDKVLEYFKNNDLFSKEKDIVIFEKRKILVRVITDYIAGMTDGYALEEFEKLR